MTNRNPPALGEEQIITADARKVTGLEFFDAVTGTTQEMREQRDRLMREQCLRAIERGDTYGWPPALVEMCREIISEREALGAQVERELRFTVELNKRRAA